VSVLGRFNEIFRHRILSEMMHDMTASPIEGGSSLELNRTNIDHHTAWRKRVLNAKAELNQPATTEPRPSSMAAIA